jgi:hypothetical protein
MLHLLKRFFLNWMYSNEALEDIEETKEEYDEYGEP